MKDKKTQRLVIPKGMIQPNEAAVIEIPRRFQRAPVVVVKRRPGEVAEARAASHFVQAPHDLTPFNINVEAPRPPFQIPQSYDLPQRLETGMSSQMPLTAIQPIIQQSQLPLQVPLRVPLQAPPQVQPSVICPGLQSPLLQTPSPGLYQVPMQAPLQNPIQPSSFCSGFLQAGYPQSIQQMCPPASPIIIAGSQCPGQEAGLQRKEKFEQEMFNRSLEEFQKARRQFLINNTVLTQKISRVSNSSCDSY